MVWSRRTRTWNLHPATPPRSTVLLAANRLARRLPHKTTMRSKIPALISMALFLAAACLAQVNSAKPNAGPKSVGSADVQAIRSSAAYAELLLHKADLDSNLNAL